MNFRGVLRSRGCYEFYLLLLLPPIQIYQFLILILGYAIKAHQGETSGAWGSAVLVGAGEPVSLKNQNPKPRVLTLVPVSMGWGHPVLVVQQETWRDPTLAASTRMIFVVATMGLWGITESSEITGIPIVGFTLQPTREIERREWNVRHAAQKTKPLNHKRLWTRRSGPELCYECMGLLSGSLD